MDHGFQRSGQQTTPTGMPQLPSHSPSRQFSATRDQNAGSWPLSSSSPQNTSALRSTVESSRGATHDEADARAFNVAPLYPPLSRFLPPSNSNSGRWMNPMMIRPIDSAYFNAQHDHLPLLPSAFPPPLQQQQQQQYAPPTSLPPLPAGSELGAPQDYYSSGSNSTSPSSMSSRSIETLDSPISLTHAHQHQQPRYQHQHHHSEPYIYTQHTTYGDDPFSRQQFPQQQYYAPFAPSLGADAYASGAGYSTSKPAPTIESFNSAVVASGAFGNNTKRKHRLSLSASDLDLFPPAKAQRTVQRSKPSSPVSSRVTVSPSRQRTMQQQQPPHHQRQSAQFNVGMQYPQQGSSLLMLDIAATPSTVALTPAAQPAPPKAAVVHPFRTFPAHVEIDTDFPLLYRKFHVPSYFAPNDPLGKFVFAEKYAPRVCQWLPTQFY